VTSSEYAVAAAAFTKTKRAEFLTQKALHNERAGQSSLEDHKNAGIAHREAAVAHSHAASAVADPSKSYAHDSKRRDHIEQAEYHEKKVLELGKRGGHYVVSAGGLKHYVKQ
jgi:hypothetical protein